MRHEELVRHVGPRTAGPQKDVDVGFGLCGRTNSRRRRVREGQTLRSHFPSLLRRRPAGRDLLEGAPDEDGIRKGGLRAKQISRASREAMDAKVTDGEVEGVMENLPLGKSAGPDSIPNGVYKCR